MTVSNECKCADQMPKIEKGIAELKQQGRDTLNDVVPAEPTEPPAEPTEPPAEPKKDVW